MRIVSFKNVEAGEQFTFNGKRFMKLAKKYKLDANKGESWNEQVNAVSILTGHLIVAFSDKEMVDLDE